MTQAWENETMVDCEKRHQLAQDVRRLVTGRMTNDEFDDAYYESYHGSEDLAIREISRFAWCLYSSDLPMSYRLRGRHAVNESTRRRAAHSVLFLQSRNEYVYPETPDTVGDSMLGCASFNGSLLGIAFTLIGLLALVSRDGETAGWCLLIGFGIIALCVLIVWGQLKSQDSFRQELETVGDTTIWPFVDRDSLGKANGNDYLLSNFKPEIAT